jgi:hypothetical protein
MFWYGNKEIGKASVPVASSLWRGCLRVRVGVASCGGRRICGYLGGGWKNQMPPVDGGCSFYFSAFNLVGVGLGTWDGTFVAGW